MLDHQSLQPLIQIVDLQKVYKLGGVEVHALRGVSATIRRGEMVALVGPSGSGKTSLMNIIGCLDRPTSGTYHLEGGDVHTFGDDQLAEVRRSKLGFVFQTFNLLQRMTAVENVSLPLLYTRATERKKRALEALERVGLAQRAHHRPTELSGGEQQRVAIARSLVNEPPILLADEPTGNLDSVVGQSIMDIFSRLNREDGITIILVTHDRDVSAAAPRVISLRDGQIVGDIIRDGGTP